MSSKPLPRSRLQRVLAAGFLFAGAACGAAPAATAGSFLENFDSITPPALPDGWTVQRGAGLIDDPLWQTSTTTPDSAPHCAFVPCPAHATDMRLFTPLWTCLSASASLTFRHAFNAEERFDGGVLEISIGGGPFLDVLGAGCAFQSGSQGYTNTISSDFSSAIAGRQSFTGNSGGYVTTTLSLPASASGQTVQFCIRFVSDTSVAGVGWRVDSFSAVDIDPCSLTCPADISVATDAGQCTALVEYTRPGGIGCGKFGCDPGTAFAFPVGQTVVTCSAGDVHCAFTVTVRDEEPPQVACPDNFTVIADGGSCGAVVTFETPTATDNCPGVTVTCEPASGSTFPIGTTVVTCLARDASGNTQTCAFQVEVLDQTAPSLTCPDDVEVNTFPGSCTAQVTFAAPTIADACPGATFEFTPASGSSFAVGATTVTCTARDVRGNASSCGFTVIVRDAEAPTVTPPAALSFATGVDCNFEFPDLSTDFVLSDNCTPRQQLAISQTPALGALGSDVDGTVTLRVVDDTGNATEVAVAYTVDNRVCDEVTNPDLACGACGNCGAGALLTLWMIPPLWWMKRAARSRRHE